jgi:hypothetical protein
MEKFKNHNLTTTEIKVVSGTITNEENELSSDTDIFYWANFIPHFDNKTIFIMGECGTNDHNKSRFFFVYNKETDTVMIKDYRFSLCSPEIYEKYYLNIQYITPRNDKTVVIPWKKIPQTRDGVAIPQLVERIFEKIPTTIVFM